MDLFTIIYTLLLIFIASLPIVIQIVYSYYSRKHGKQVDEFMRGIGIIASYSLWWGLFIGLIMMNPKFQHDTIAYGCMLVISIIIYYYLIPVEIIENLEKLIGKHSETGENKTG